MFEKEAESYATRECCMTCNNINHFCKEKCECWNFAKKGAEFGIAALVSVVDLCTANNTIAIVMAGPLAKNIADEYNIDARKSASILDIFSSVWQGIIPYGAQLLTAAGLAGISPFAIISYLHYPILMFVCGILAISFGLPRVKSSEKKLEGIA